MNAPNLNTLDLRRGVLLALGRDDAKGLFAARGDENLREFLQHTVPRGVNESEQSIDCEGRWKTIQQRLSEQATDDRAAPLKQCILGGRPMYEGDEMSVHLVRPDMVPHVATAISEIGEPSLFQASNGAPDKDGPTLERVFLKIRRFYQSAAANRSAVVFAVEH